MATSIPDPKAASKDASIEKDIPKDNPKEERSRTPFEGRLVGVSGNKLVMMSKQGKEYSRTLAADAKITKDGTACTAENLKAGSLIRVTSKPDDRHTVTCVESLDTQTEFAASAT